MPYPVQEGRFARLLRRAFGIQGHVGLQAIDDVFPFYDLLGGPLEQAWLRDEHLFAYHSLVAAVVGNFGRVDLQLPAEAQHLMVVEKLFLSVSASSDVHYGILTDLGAGGGQVVATRDGRLGTGSAASSARISTSAAGALSLSDIVPRVSVLPTPDRELDPELVIVPGQEVRVECLTANTAMSVTFYWREVPVGLRRDP